MAERSIPEEWVALCLSDPDQIEPDPKPDRIRYLRCVPGQRRPLRVVVRIRQQNYVITVHPDGRFLCPQ